MTLPMLFDPAEGGPGLERAMTDLCGRGGARRPRRHQHPDSVGSRRQRDARRRFRACWRRPACTITWCARACARGARSSSSRATRAKCTTSRCSSATAPARSIPYLAFETLDDMIRQGALEALSHTQAVTGYIKALNLGILKVMSKMGISALQSYCGAQIFEAIGLERSFVDRYFTSTASRIGGVGIDVIAEEVRRRHARAYVPRAAGDAGSRVRRRVPVAPRRRVPPLQSRHGVQAAARDAERPVRDLPRVRAGS